MENSDNPKGNKNNKQSNFAKILLNSYRLLKNIYGLYLIHYPHFLKERNF